VISGPFNAGRSFFGDAKLFLSETFLLAFSIEGAAQNKCPFKLVLTHLDREPLLELCQNHAGGTTAPFLV
jgi:hypothetical protein